MKKVSTSTRSIRDFKYGDAQELLFNDCCLSFKERRHKKKKIELEMKDDSFMYGTPAEIATVLEEIAKEIRKHYKVVSDDAMRVAIP